MESLGLSLLHYVMLTVHQDIDTKRIGLTMMRKHLEILEIVVVVVAAVVAAEEMVLCLTKRTTRMSL